MINLNTNLSSLIAQGSLKESTLSLNQAIERMSTGFKINHASDNAANYSISTNMTTKIGAYQVAEENAAMGLDLLATAEGSLSQISEKLGRLRALAVQAENGTYGDKSLKAINAEANALIDEIARITNTTEYNGIKLFNKTSQFIDDIDKRDTSGMTKLGSISDTMTISSGTYSISTAEELAQLAKMTDNGLIQGGEFVLANDIDLKEYCAQYGWNSIGDGSHAFVAEFDGNGFSVKNLSMTGSTRGLFVVISGSVKNLGVENVNLVNTVDYNNTIGGLAGVLYGTIENSFVTGIVRNEDTVGDGYAGGLVGTTNIGSKITSCYVEADVFGKACVGGLVGNFCGEVYNSYSKGSVLSLNGGAGGLIGTVYRNADMKIINSYSESNVLAMGNGAGGLIGTFGLGNLVARNCYSEGSVEGSYYVGGFIGSSTSNKLLLDNCYSTASVKGERFVGGVLGCIESSDANVLQNVYSLGTVEATVYTLGVMVGSLYQANPTFENCYYKEVEGVNLIGTNSDLKDGMNLYKGEVPFSYTKKSFDFQVGIYDNDSSQLSIETTLDLKEIFDLKTIAIDNRKNYIDIIDKLTLNISTALINYGSISNRLDSVLDEIGIQYDNLVSSRSTIRDADIAEVSANYIQQQILQQASATLLATANQSPSIALQLI